MKVDIIIPCHNRAEHTRQTIESLYENTPVELFNLYVIDDGSQLETGALLVELQKKYSFSLLIHAVAKGPASSRNEVTKLITDTNQRSDFLYHSDNDVYFTKDWLQNLVKVFSRVFVDVKVLGASCHPFLQDKLRFGVAFPYSVGYKDAVSGYSQLMTWETWDKYGPFEENQGTQEKKIMGSEDWSFCQRVIKDGFKVGSIEPEVVIPCGKTNTYGDPATGAETFKEVAGVKVL